MRKSLPFWAVIAICAIALVASSLLLVDYVRPAPVFCAEDGGCGAVKLTIFAKPFGIPTPFIGVGGLLAIGLAQLLPGRRARIAQAVLGVIGGIVATGLIVVQVMMHTVCPYCAVVDGSALLLAALSFMRASRGWDPPDGLHRDLVAGAFAMICAVVAPITIGMLKKPIIPDAIADEIKKTPPGKVTVIDFVDFECPFCRMTHAEFGPLLAQRHERVRVVRKNVPLRMHPHAKDAARAACCGESQGKGDEIAEALFSTNADELTPEGCATLAQQHGLDVAKFKDCFKDPATDARIEADIGTFRAVHGHGLPTIYIGEMKLEGSQEPGVLEHTLDTAIKAL